MASVNIRIDDSVKKQVETIFEELGLNMTSATLAFYKQVIRCKGIPFELKVDPFYSESNQKHIKESIEQIQAGKVVIKTMEELEELEVE